MKIRLALLISCVLLTACSVGETYKQPPTPTPPAFTNSSAAAPAAPDVEWWKQFNSPQLTTLMTDALANNYDIKAAVARIHQADAQLQITGATLFPSLDADGSAQRSQTSTQTGSESGTSKKFVGNSYNASLLASYELDFWGKNRAATASAQALLNASQYDKESVALTIATGVANTYFDLLATQERLTAAQGNLASSERLLQAFNHRFTEGLASSLDVAQQKNLVATQRATLPPLQLQLQQDKNALAILVGKLPENFDVDLGATYLVNVVPPQIAPGLPSQLLARRPDVAEAEADLISAHENITAARAALFPDITLTAEGGYASNLLSNLFTPGGKFFTLGAGLTQPIFHAGALSGAIELENAKYDELLQDYQKSVISAFSDTENALAGTARNAELESDQQANVATAQQAYDLTQQQFQQGIVDITSVLNTERSLYSAEDALAQAQLARLQASVSLYAALGGGWQKP